MRNPTSQLAATTTARRLLTGDRHALTEVLRWIASVLTSRRFSCLKGGELVDLHQEVLQELIRSLRRGNYDPTLSFRIYVQSIARYTALDHLQRSRRDPTSVPLLGSESDPTDYEEAFVAHLDVNTYLSRCSSSCRLLLERFFFERRSYQEISDMTGTPVGTVKSRIARCLKRLNRAAVAKARR